MVIEKAFCSLSKSSNRVGKNRGSFNKQILLFLGNYWTPAPAAVTYEFGTVHPFVRSSVRPFVCSQHQLLELDRHFFLIFCMKLDSHKVRIVRKPEF